MNIYDYLPELKKEPFSVFCASTKPLKEFTPDQQECIITYTITKMIDYYQGARFFWNSKDEANMLIASWVSGLCGTNPRAIFNGLLQVVTGKTKYIDVPPRSVIQFHDICHNGIHNQMVSSPFPKPTALMAPEDAKYGSEEVKAKSMAEIRAIMKRKDSSGFKHCDKHRTCYAASMVCEECALEAKKPVPLHPNRTHHEERRS